MLDEHESVRTGPPKCVTLPGCQVRDVRTLHGGTPNVSVRNSGNQMNPRWAVESLELADSLTICFDPIRSGRGICPALSVSATE